MNKLKKLPDTEFEIMKIVWENTPPITNNMIMQQLGIKREWKTQTVNSLMSRLVKRGFLQTEKRGRERIYFPLIEKEVYLKFETDKFVEQFHNNSFINLANTLYGEKSLTDKDVNELLKWVEERRE